MHFSQYYLNTKIVRFRKLKELQIKEKQAQFVLTPWKNRYFMENNFAFLDAKPNKANCLKYNDYGMGVDGKRPIWLHRKVEELMDAAESLIPMTWAHHSMLEYINAIHECGLISVKERDYLTKALVNC